MEENKEEEDGDNYPMYPAYGDTATGEAENQEASDEPADDLGCAIVDAWRDCGTDNKRSKFARMLEDHNKPLYPNCEDGLKKLGSTVVGLSRQVLPLGR